MSQDFDRFLTNARGSAATAKIVSLDELRAHRGAQQSDAAWGLAALRGRLVELSARGATATLTAAIEIVAEAQGQAEPVAWFTLRNGTFYPPDVAESGVDLAALVVVRASDATALSRAAERCLRSGAFGLVILDLGSSGDLSMQIQGRLVTLAQTHDAAVLCLTDKTGDTASIGSLVSLRAEALRSHAPRAGTAVASSASGASGGATEMADVVGDAVVDAVAAALASMKSHGPDASGERKPWLRGPPQPDVDRLRAAETPFEVGVRVLKDKRRGPGFTQTLKRRGPAGLI